MIGKGWVTKWGRPTEIPDKSFHTEYSNADGSTIVRLGKKRTHRPFEPIM